MPDAYEIAEVADASSWDDFVRSAVGGSVFSTSSWLRCARTVSGGEIRCFGCYKNGRLIAGLCGLEQRRRPFTRLATPLLTPHTGLLFAPISSKGPGKLEAERNRAASLLIEDLVQRYDRLHLVHTPAVRDVREFTWAGWDARIRYTYWIDLSDLDALWGRMERRTRTVIRKAEKAGFRLQSTDDTSLFRRQYEMIYARQGIPPPVAPSLAERFAREVLSAGLGRGYAIASPAGETASIVFFVDGFDTTYAWTAGADPTFQSTGATSLLYWRCFEQASFRKFDFVGANIPSIARFKRGFGGDLVSYYAVEGFRNGRVRKIFALRRAVRNLFARPT